MTELLPARAFWVEGPLAGSVRPAALPPPRDGELRVDTLYSAVSRGTESLVWAGRVPHAERQRMRCPHQEGELPFPVKYGYSNVGMVSAGPPSLVGRAVFCLYPHQSSYVVNADAVLPLPADVPPARAVLAANMETALNALWDAGVMIGDRLSVVGAGVVGALTAFLASKIIGVRVELVDVLPERAELARALGVEFSLPDQARRGRDLVFHASASAAGLATALALVADEGSVMELSWYGAGEVAVELGGRFHSGRLALRASQVGRVSRNARPRYDFRERLSLALGLCADAALDALITGECALEELPALMPELADPKRGVLCQRVRHR